MINRLRTLITPAESLPNSAITRLAVLVMLLSTLVIPAATAQVVPTGFSEDIIATGLINPTDFAFLPDGRILLVEKNGIVRVYKNGGILPTPLIDIRSKVNDYWDRGMTAIAADPDFATNGFVYLWYVFENDASDYSGPKTVRLTRITVSGDTAQPSTEVVLLGSISGPSCGGQPLNADCIPADSPSHNGGTIKFAADKTIFVTTGDGGSFTVIDPLSLRAQSLDSLAGKLLHITKAGKGMASNPYSDGNVNSVQSKVWAYGFRNPLRATLKPGTGTPYVGDVGLSTYEEVNVATAGANLGWPCYEGPFRQPGFQDFPECQALYNTGDTHVKAPLVWYPHNDISAAVIGGVFYTGTTYPPAYQQAYFYGDYAQGWVNYFRTDANDAVSGSVTTFETGAPGPVKFDTGPNGDLYYVAILTGELRHLGYVIGQPATTRELSAVSWTSAANGWGPVERDMSNGDQAARDGTTITINGSVFPKGIGVNSPSDIRFRLDGQCTSFSTHMGIDDEVGSAGSVVFQVWVDGVKRYDSGIMTGAMPALSTTLNIAGGQELSLQVTDGGDGSDSDHADWADATITCGGSTAPLFATAVSMPAGVETHGVQVADLNGDAKLDIVAVSAGSNYASVWLGNGDGTFGTRADYPTGAFPKNVAVGDLNKDGRPDLVTANQDGSSISVLLSTGSGHFGAKVDYPSCMNAHEAAIGDFNRDGSADVIVACWGGSVVSVFLGRGDGTFGLKTDIATGAAPHSVVVGDFNKDGFLDAAVANHDSGDVSVLLGKGNGTFNPEVRYTVGSGPHSIRMGDLNGDGFQDLVTANEFSDTVSVLLGRAGGTFAAAVSYPVGSVPKGVAIADVDGDGLLDVLATNTAGNYPNCCFPGGDTMTVLHGNGDGTFVSIGTYTVGTTPFSAATGDFNGDGHTDVVTANWNSNDVTILKNLGGADMPPVITNVAASNLKSTSATISWTTNEVADGQVEYGLSTSYGTSSPLRSTLVTTHQEVLTGLTANTLYHYRVRSRDGAGGLTLSGDHTFTSGTGSGGTTYVSDLTWTSMTNGWGPVERDHSNGEAAAGDGSTIKLRGVTYSKGLGTNAASDVRYAIPAGCTQFVADVGLDDEVSPNGSVSFQVWGDAVQLYGSPILTSSSPTIQISADLTGRTQLRLVVTDGGDGNSSDHGDWAGARLVCSQQVNNPPVATISTPASSLLFKVGDVINYAGSATDTEDGAIPAANLNWNIILHHCPDGSCHTHPFLNVNGASGNFTVPDHGEGIFFEIILTATDSLGLTGSDTRIINPQTVTITLNTVPSGLQVVYGGIQATAPVAINTVVGSSQTILAPSPQGASTFVSWSDGGAQQHNVVAGTAPVTYTATFNTSGSQTTYVSDLTWTSMTNGWGPVEVDHSNGEAAAGDGAVIKLKGVPYTKGLGTNAASDVRFAIPAGCTQFASDIGIDDEVAPNSGSVVFQVWGDAVMLVQSSLLTSASATTQLVADLTGRSVLRLVVTDGGNGTAYDHGDWANARLTCGGGTDTTPPTVTTTSPAAGATNVAVTSNVTATFSEAMTASTLTTTSVTLKQGTTAVAATVSYDNPSLTVTLHPTAALAAGTIYTATITTAAKDLAGNALAAAKTWSFTTATAGDTTPPTVTTTNPAAGATNVAASSNVTATFSEAMAPATLTTTSVTLKQGTTAVAATVSYDNPSLTVTLHPTASLAASTTYTATITTAATDVAGNALAAAKTWSFTTAAAGGSTTFVSDLTWTSMTNGWGPVEVDHSNGESAAGDGAVIKLKGVPYTKGLGTNAASDVRFAIPAGCTQFASDIGIDDEVAPNSGSVVFQVWGDAVMLVQSSVLTSASATTQLVADLTGRSVLRLVVTDGGDGNAYDHGDWANARLMCGGTDTTPPTVTTTNPASGATNVAVTSNVTATFSEAMAPATLTTTSVTLKQGTTAVAATVSYDNPSLTVTLHPTASLAASTTYTATITTAATDVAGNALAAAKTWSFTTAAGADTTPPTVTTTNPASGATNVAVASNVTATFSEAMAAATLTASSVTLKQGATAVAATVSYDNPSLTVTLHPTASLAASTTYTATITTAATDVAGNALAAAKTWSFTTAAAGGSTTFVSDLTWTSMTNGWGPVEVDHSNGEAAAGDGGVIKLKGVPYTKGLGTNAASDVRFAIPAGCTQFASDIGIDDEVAPNSGSVVFQVWGDAVMLVQSSVLTSASATTQLVADLTGRGVLRLVVTDGGNGTAFDHGDWANARLTCGGADTTPPTVTTVTPAQGATGVAKTVNVTARFSEAMLASSLTTSTVTLVAQGTTTVVPAAVTYSTANMTVTLNPTATNLAGSTVFTAKITGGSSGAKDAAGNALAADRTWTFTTAP